MTPAHLGNWSAPGHAEDSRGDHRVEQPRHLVAPPLSGWRCRSSAGTEGMLETECSDQATVFAAPGHPVRLELLRHTLSGVHPTADREEIESIGTTGQLHHHLRQPAATEWVRQSGREITSFLPHASCHCRYA